MSTADRTFRKIRQARPPPRNAAVAGAICRFRAWRPVRSPNGAFPAPPASRVALPPRALRRARGPGWSRPCRSRRRGCAAGDRQGRRAPARTGGRWSPRRAPARRRDREAGRAGPTRAARGVGSPVPGPSAAPSEGRGRRLTPAAGRRRRRRPRGRDAVVSQEAGAGTAPLESGRAALRRGRLGAVQRALRRGRPGGMRAREGRAALTAPREGALPPLGLSANSPPEYLDQDDGRGPTAALSGGHCAGPRHGRRRGRAGAAPCGFSPPARRIRRRWAS